jgi:hypothetical protein
MSSSATLAPRRNTFRLIRQIHLWVGAWGALAAILFGFTGFVQNHRAIWKLPQGNSVEVDKVELPVPEAARATPDSLRSWLRDDQHVDIDTQRVQPGKPVEFNGQRIRQPAHWSFTGGNARKAVQGEYSEGANTLTLRTTAQSTLAIMSRLHKGVGGGLAWILLTDSFALAMIALGISGLLLWGRGRTTRETVVSVVGLGLLAVLVIGGMAVA